ncbi:MAG: YkgJ family cysteine cluster protein [bacterium]
MTKFICKACGECCKGEGAVFLYPEDIKKIAENYSMTIQEAVNEYTEYVMLETIEKSGSYSYMPFLILKKNKSECIFLNSSLCVIHKFKPFQCEKSPFIVDFYTDEAWQAHIKKMCPALEKAKKKDFLEYSSIAEITEKAELDYYRLLQENSFNLEKILDIELPSPKPLTYHG